MKYRPDIPRSGWYTYGLFLNGIPFYIGKGSGKRALTHFYPSYLKHGRNPWKSYIIRKYWKDVEVIILTTHEEERAAFSSEEFLIAHYGTRKDGGLLVNQTSGGEGTSGLIVTDELKHRRGASIRKFTEEAFITALEAYYVEGLSQEKAAAILGIHQSQFAKCIAGKTVSVLEVLAQFQSNHPEIDFSSRSNTKLNKPENIQQVKLLIEKGNTAEEIKQITGFGKTTIFRYLKEIEGKLNGIEKQIA